MQNNQQRTQVDLRSDTLTKPCSAMRKVMAAAEVGDDVFGEDPNVNRLENQLAERAGHEAGLYCASGTQSNLVALLAHCQRGDEYIVGQNAHTYKYEGGGAAVLGSIQPQPIEHADDGTIPLEKITKAIKADDFHFARTRLLALENTIGGKVISQDYIAQARRLVDQNTLALHLDGARVFNAAVALGLELEAITKQFDSVSLCMSKGLGAPVGSVLVGPKPLMDEARRWRKMVGGGMRQAGILASAALYALEHNVERLAEDHSNAQALAKRLQGIDTLEIVGGGAHTNMVYLRCTDGKGQALLDWCTQRGVLFTGTGPARLVVHKDISAQMIDQAADVILQYYGAA
jgi:threonine aldolase